MTATIAFSIESLSTQLADILSPYPVMRAYLYGSAAAGRATPLSDVDIALVTTADPITPSERLKLELKIADEIANRCRIRNAFDTFTRHILDFVERQDLKDGRSSPDA